LAMAKSFRQGLCVETEAYPDQPSSLGAGGGLVLPSLFSRAATTP
jgi:hypothetical protein